MNTRISRRRIVQTAAALPLFGIRSSPVQAASFSYSLGTGQSMFHPVNQQALAAASRILAGSGGQLKIQLFPAGQLGTDLELLAKVQTGDVQFINIASSVLSSRVPAAGIVNTGFAFDDYAQVWQAMDGALGAFVTAQIAQAGLMVIGKSWDNGYRQITASANPVRAPADLAGFKIRVPSARMIGSLFQALGATAVPLDFSQVYAALQSGAVDGQENPLPIISSGKLYEVQKYCSLTSHVWDGYWILANPAAFQALPTDLQALLLHEFGSAGQDERNAISVLNDTLRQNLTLEGLDFVDVDKRAFRTALGGAGYYAKWKASFGDETWGLLEQFAGPLA
jgi:tripartite ATP-independent transporter DctP family solute receptor